VDWKKRYELATRKESDYLSSLAINDGLYIVDGARSPTFHSRQLVDWDNRAHGELGAERQCDQGTRLRLQHGLLWAEMRYSSAPPTIARPEVRLWSPPHLPCARNEPACRAVCVVLCTLVCSDMKPCGWAGTTARAG